MQPLPANGVLYVDDGEVTLKGILKGQLTIGADENIRITDDVTYSDNPRNNADSTDILGIIAGQNVIVDRDAPRNVDIEASIIALNRSFGVEGWWVGPARGTLGVYGGIIQANRGIVGRFNSRTGRPLSGYKKQYRYDDRLRTLAPPFFPTTGEYDALLWQEQ